MADKETEPEYKPYSERLNEALEDTRNELFKARNAPQSHIRITPQEETFAKAFINLTRNPDFKVFMDFENREASTRIVEALNPPSKNDFNTEDFGLQMAYNKGRIFQARYFKSARDSIISTYLAYLKQSEEQNGEDKIH